MGKIFKGTLGLSALVAVAAPVAASAQTETTSLFGRERNTSVMEREREGYMPTGIRTGQFIVRPRLDVTVAYSDNVYGLDSDTDNPNLLRDLFSNQEDFYFIVRPSILAESDWNNHKARAGAYVEAVRHIDFDGENIANAGIFADGVYDVTRNAQLIAGAGYDLLHESRRANANGTVTEEPIEYSVVKGFVGGQQELGRFRYRGRFDVAAYDYDDVTGLRAITTNGIESVERFILDQNFRDRTDYTVLGELGWALTRDSAMFLRGTYNIRDHDLDGRFVPATATNIARDFELDSDGWSIMAGIDFDVTKLVRGNIAIGYMEQSYDAQNEFDENGIQTLIGRENIDGLSIDGGVEWFATELTTVGVQVSRSIRDSQFLNSAGFTASEATVRVDHELRRNVVVSASATYGNDEYEGSGLEFERVGFGVGGTYFLNRNLQTSLNYTYVQQESNGLEGNLDGLAREYEVNEVFLTLTAQR